MSPVFEGEWPTPDDAQAAERLVDAVFPSVDELKRRRDEAWVAMNAACDADSEDYYELFDIWHEASDAYQEAIDDPHIC